MNPSKAQNSNIPFVSVVVCTCNRGDSIYSTLTTILANTYPHFELIVIDQSTNDATACAIAPLLADPRLRYLSTDTHGLSVARNIGLSEATAEIVFMTDDDCDVPRDWLLQMVTILTCYPKVALIFCDVLAAPHDTDRGWIPVHLGSENRLIRRLNYRYAMGVGMGAGLALRRTAIQSVGGFDTFMGSGSYFRSGEDIDITLRILLQGYAVYQTKATHVIHHGFRTNIEGRELMNGAMFSMGALYVKLIRCGYWHLILFYIFLFWKLIIYPIFESIINLRRPPILGRAINLLKGFFRALRTPIDHNNIIFQSYSNH